MNITWYASDGYVNPGPQTCHIPDEELEGLTIEEAMEEVEESLKADFQEKVSIDFDEDDVRERVRDLLNRHARESS